MKLYLYLLFSLLIFNSTTIGLKYSNIDPQLQLNTVIIDLSENYLIDNSYDEFYAANFNYLGHAMNTDQEFYKYLQDNNFSNEDDDYYNLLISFYSLDSEFVISAWNEMTDTINQNPYLDYFAIAYVYANIILSLNEDNYSYVFRKYFNQDYMNSGMERSQDFIDITIESMASRNYNNFIVALTNSIIESQEFYNNYEYCVKLITMMIVVGKIRRIAEEQQLELPCIEALYCELRNIMNMDSTIDPLIRYDCAILLSSYIKCDEINSIIQTIKDTNLDDNIRLAWLYTLSNFVFRISNCENLSDLDILMPESLGLPISRGHALEIDYCRSLTIILNELSSEDAINIFNYVLSSIKYLQCDAQYEAEHDSQCRSIGNLADFIQYNIEYIRNYGLTDDFIDELVELKEIQNGYDDKIDEILEYLAS
jgi:hypothetical protein